MIAVDALCATCAYWTNDPADPALAHAARRPDGFDETVGACQFNPPTVVPSFGSFVAVFPLVHRDRFCSNWMWDSSLGNGPDGGEEADNVVPMRGAA